MTDHTDIVEKLNGFVACDGGDLADVEEAAAEITHLRAEAETLRNALFEILRVHANDNIRPKAFYIASDATKGTT